MPFSGKKAFVDVRFDFAGDFVVERPNAVAYLNKRIGGISIRNDLAS